MGGQFRMDFKEISINTRNWVNSAHDVDYWRVLVNAEFNLRVPYTMKLTFLFIASFTSLLTFICKSLLLFDVTLPNVL